jgi:hypothetical protein
VKLYRRSDLAALNIPANHGFVYPSLPGLAALVAAFLLVLGHRGRRAKRAPDETPPVTSLADAGKG